MAEGCFFFAEIICEEAVRKFSARPPCFGCPHKTEMFFPH